MTQTSYFWSGTTTGDATLAPYDYADYAEFFENIAGNFVVPGFLYGGTPNDELNVEGDPGNFGQVIIKPGVALVHGVLYALDAETTLAIPATAGANPAIYRIVLDKDTVNQTVRLALSQGTAAALPEPPAVASNEMTIAWIWIDGAYDPATDLVSDVDIHDERVFYFIGAEDTKHLFQNILPNGQFLGHSGGANSAPDGWQEINTPTITYAAGGRSSCSWVCRLQGGINEGIETTFPVNHDTGSLTEVYTLRGYVEVDSDSFDIEVYAVALGGASTLFTTKTFNAMVSPTSANNGIREFIIRVHLNLTSSQTALRIKVICNAGTTDAYIGDLAVIPGYVAGTLETVKVSEVIMLDHALTDAGWTSTAKSTGTTLVNLGTSFGSMINEGVRGVICRVQCRDSGSAAAAVNDGAVVRIYPYWNVIPAGGYVAGVVSCVGLPNDSWASGLIYVPTDPSDGGPRIYIGVVATGVLTMDVTLEIIGIVTL